MNNIVKRLRALARRDGDDLLAKAADEIERLNAVIKAGRLCDPIHCTFGNENEIERLRTEARALSNAYVRLRCMIPGALNTPFAPTSEQVWQTTETALRKALEPKP